MLADTSATDQPRALVTSFRYTLAPKHAEAPREHGGDEADADHAPAVARTSRGDLTQSAASTGSYWTCGRTSSANIWMIWSRPR
jgi:hypothetical protein